MDRRDPDVETRREAGVGVTAAQVREDEQRLPATGEAAPAGADLAPVPRKQTGKTLQGAAGQIDGRRVDKHESSWRTGDLGREPV
ncbi:hypothetical protein ACE1SV_35250 [Streptomyces sennicomposti]